MEIKSYVPFLFVVIVLAGCGGGVREDVAAEQRVERVCRTGDFRLLGADDKAWAAVVQDSARAYREPGRTTIASFRSRNVNGVPTVLGVLGEVVDRNCEALWYRVKLPRRPNGVVGYVRAKDVEVAAVRTRIVVDLSDRRVTLFRDGKRYLSSRAAIGSPATPTPTGRFYVDQRLIPLDQTGPFGPGAIGVAAYSDVLTGWAQGGPIAIHGTNRPDSIGRAVSNGCIRVPNHVLRRMWSVTLSGTPVLIRP